MSTAWSYLTHAWRFVQTMLGTLSNQPIKSSNQIDTHSILWQQAGGALCVLEVLS